jgi:hypothetical protein
LRDLGTLRDLDGSRDDVAVTTGEDCSTMSLGKLACLDRDPNSAARRIRATAAPNACSTASYASAMKGGRQAKKTTPILSP